MSNYDIDRNPALVRQIIENSKSAHAEYLASHPDSVLPPFERELRDIGFQFEISEQVKQFLPRHKRAILPIAIRYYRQATYDNERDYFIGLFHYRGFEEVVPMLLDDFHSDKTAELTRQFIGETLRVIRSEKYLSDHLSIIACPRYGLARAPIFSLVGSLKAEQAIPVLIDILEADADFAPCALQTLAVYRRPELRPHFERFIGSPDEDLRKIARRALKALG